MNKIQVSKYLSLILRHHPEVVNLKLDAHGWVNTNMLIKEVAKKFPGFNQEILDEVVATNNKKRFSYNEDKTKIRANQGHSIQVDVELEKRIPPDILYHGTSSKVVTNIQKEGLLPQKRLHVHLSKDIPTAIAVGKRHGQPVVFRINSKQMIIDGYIFYYSLNGIWLTNAVPPQYLELIDISKIEI